MHASAILSVLVATVGLASAQDVITPPVPGATPPAGARADSLGCTSTQEDARLKLCLSNLMTQNTNRNCDYADWRCKCEGEQALQTCYIGGCIAAYGASAQKSTMLSICGAADAQAPVPTVNGKAKPAATDAPTGTSGKGSDEKGSADASATTSSASASSTNGASSKTVSMAVMSLPMVFVAFFATL